MPKKKEYTLYNTFIDTAVERIIAYFWSKLTIKETGDHNCDYGNHSLILNFPSSSPQQQQHEQHPRSYHEQRWGSVLNRLLYQKRRRRRRKGKNKVYPLLKISL
jgi:hypothetical protein